MGLLAIDFGSSTVKKGLDDIATSADKTRGILEILGGTASGALGGAITGFALFGSTLGPVAGILGGIAGGLLSLVNGFIGYNNEIEEANRLTETYGESIAKLDEETRNTRRGLGQTHITVEQAPIGIGLVGSQRTARHVHSDITVIGPVKAIPLNHSRRRGSQAGDIAQRIAVKERLGLETSHR